MGELIQHHVKYKEIHGIDEIVLMTPSEHRILHNKLRRTGKCNIPAKELNKISTRAHGRTEKGKLSHKKSNQSKISKASQKKYKKENERSITFSEQLMPKVRLYEQLKYNTKTGNVSWTAYFKIRRS